jgi:3-oxoacyl-(acyl-carrier-protein) synthase
MRRALDCGGFQPAEIDFVSTHGTATPDNDAMESAALKRLFGGKVPPFASVKRFFGHTLAASGAIKAVLAVQSLREQAVPGTPGFEVADEKIGLAPVREFRAQPVSAILSNSFGFGGNNVALVFSHADARPGKTSAVTVVSETGGQREGLGSFAILGAGVISAAGHSPAAVAATLRAGGAPVSLAEVPALSPSARARVYACGDFGAEQFFEPSRRRKLSRLQQMTLIAARQALSPELAASAGPENICVAIGTGLGSLADTAAFVENLILKDERAPRPALFTSSVHNSLASQTAMEQHLTGLNSTPVQREISFETALWQAATELAAGRAGIALAGAADELNQYQLAAGLRWGWWNDASPEPAVARASRPRGSWSQSAAWAVGASPEIRPFVPLPGRMRPLPGEGCALFALGRTDATAKPLATVCAIRIGRSETRAAEAEAQWILETLNRAGVSATDLDLLLTGANGLRAADEFYQAVAAALARLAGRPVACGAYKQGCGEFHSASAFGFLTAIGLVRGEITAEKPCRTVVLFTLSPAGTKGMCCVRA